MGYLLFAFSSGSSLTGNAGGGGFFARFVIFYRSSAFSGDGFTFLVRFAVIGRNGMAAVFVFCYR
ncbi:MAG: hypothetical protein WC071_10065 [Victivallaceae bacterium]